MKQKSAINNKNVRFFEFRSNWIDEFNKVIPQTAKCPWAHEFTLIDQQSLKEETNQWQQPFLKEETSQWQQLSLKDETNLQEFTNTSGWQQQFLNECNNEKSSDWQQQFFNEFNDEKSSQWQQQFFNEFNKEKPSDSLQADSWIAEFSEKIKMEDGTERIEMARTAQELLESLHLEGDEKLAKSRFVAYLRQLVQDGVCPIFGGGFGSDASFQQWKGQYLNSISSIQSNNDLTQPKDWEHFQAHGFGYEGYAAERHGQYMFSVPIGANPYRNNGLEQATSTTKDAILALEARLYADPKDAAAWSQLGHLQQLNEMDVQAIPAFLRATQLDPGNSTAWLGLAASCANENCIPDALEALLHLGRLGGTDGDPFSQARHSILTASSISEGRRAEALGILSSISGNHQEALEHFQQALQLCPGDPTLLNRLGATLANLQRYTEALKVYDQIEEPSVRVLYNRAISQMALKDQLHYQQALGSLVKALSLQLPVDISSSNSREDVGGYTAVWDTLRLLLQLIDRNDLAGLVDMRNLTALQESLPSTGTAIK